MRTDSDIGKSYSLIIGLYLMIKQLLNLVIGFSAVNVIQLLLAVAAFFLLMYGVKYCNVLIALVIVANACINLPGNLSNIGLNIYLLYTLEGIADIACGYFLVMQREIQLHFKRNI